MTNAITPALLPDMPNTGGKKLKESATQFEAFLLGQMLRSLRESDGGGWMGTGEYSTAAPVMEMAEEQFAQALTAQGGLGLANMVITGLERQDATRDQAAADKPASARANEQNDASSKR